MLPSPFMWKKSWREGGVRSCLTLDQFIAFKATVKNKLYRGEEVSYVECFIALKLWGPGEKKKCGEGGVLRMTCFVSIWILRRVKKKIMEEVVCHLMYPIL